MDNGLIFPYQYMCVIPKGGRRRIEQPGVGYPGANTCRGFLLENPERRYPEMWNG